MKKSINSGLFLKPSSVLITEAKTDSLCIKWLVMICKLRDTISVIWFSFHELISLFCSYPKRYAVTNHQHCSVFFFLALQTFSIHLLGRCNLQTYLWSLISPYWMWLVNSCSGISVSLNTDALVSINCLPLSRVFLSASCVLVNGKLGTRLTLFVFLISSYYLGQGWNTFTCASDQCSVHYITSCSS